MYLRLLFVVAFISALAGSLHAQDKSTSRWYFGNKQGLNFNTTPPSLLTDGQSVHIEGTSVVSDAVTGALLFYSDGNTIWNRNHAVMATALNPNYLSSTQSVLILRQPGSNTLYHMFTTENQGQGKARHFVIDIAQNGGLGGVITSDNALTPVNVTEKVTATRACNGIDYWIIFRRNGAGSRGFFSYRLTPAGLLATPTNSVVGIDIVGVSPNIGEMKISPDGRHLASANDAADCELFDFDNSSGVVSNAQTLNLNTQHYCYGITFSASSRYLFVNSGWRGPKDSVVRFDVTTTPAQNSKQVVARSQAALGFMELAPDGKIYIARYNTTFLATITNPEDPTPVFDDNAVTLTANTFWGLPNFPQDLFIPNYAGNDTLVCPNTPTRIGIAAVSGLTYQWSPPTGLDNPQIAQPTATVPVTTQYTVTVSDARACQIVRSVTVNVRPRPLISVQSNAVANTICPDGTAQLTAALAGAQSFTWQPGNINGASVSVKPTQSTSYIVTVVDANGCSWVDSIRITVRARPTITFTSSEPLVNDTVRICQGTQLTIGVDAVFKNVQWSSGETSNSITVSAAGKYIVNVTDLNGCTNKDSFELVLRTLPPANAGADTAVCVTTPASFTASGGTAYQWSSLADAPPLTDSLNAMTQFTPQKAGTFLYAVRVTDANGCVNRDTVQLIVRPLPTVMIAPAVTDTLICSCDVLVITASNGASYQWLRNGVALPNQTGQTLSVVDSGLYTVRLTDVNGCSNVSAPINVRYIPLSANIHIGVADSAEAGQDVKLQLRATSVNLTRCAVDSATVYLSMNRHPMAPALGETGGSIVEPVRQLKLRLSFKTGTAALDLRYIGTLGLIDTTRIRIDSVTWDRCSVAVSSDTATFRLAGICRARGDKRLYNEGLITMMLQPHPVQEQTHCVVESDEALDNASIVVRDILGRNLGTLYEGAIPPGSFRIPLNTEHLPEGSYILVLSSTHALCTSIMEVRR